MTEYEKLREALDLEHSILRGPAHGYGGAIRTAGDCDICRLLNALATPAPDALRKTIAEYLSAYDALNGAHEARLAVGTDWTRLTKRYTNAEAALRAALVAPEKTKAEPIDWSNVVVDEGDEAPD